MKDGLFIRETKNFGPVLKCAKCGTTVQADHDPGGYECLDNQAMRAESHRDD